MWITVLESRVSIDKHPTISQPINESVEFTERLSKRESSQCKAVLERPWYKKGSGPRRGSPVSLKVTGLSCIISAYQGFVTNIILSKVLLGVLYGFVECNIAISQNIKDRLSDMAPISRTLKLAENTLEKLCTNLPMGTSITFLENAGWESVWLTNTSTYKSLVLVSVQWPRGQQGVPNDWIHPPLRFAMLVDCQGYMCQFIGNFSMGKPSRIRKNSNRSTLKVEPLTLLWPSSPRGSARWRNCCTTSTKCMDSHCRWFLSSSIITIVCSWSALLASLVSLIHDWQGFFSCILESAIVQFAKLCTLQFDYICVNQIVV